ncbi:Abi-like protein, partial [Malacoplasma iowae DK-CPA]
FKSLRILHVLWFKSILSSLYLYFFILKILIFTLSQYNKKPPGLFFNNGLGTTYIY